jgi:RimJ/RimL family protein N-acetyltransferase
MTDARSLPQRFETERLLLLPWQERHVAPFARLNADPEVMRYFPSVLSEDQTRASVTGWQEHLARHGWSNWAVELKGTGEFIGFVGLWIPSRPMPFGDCVEIGWRLARRHWSQGYASEAAREALRFGFCDIGLEEIVAFTALVNQPSRAVMERIGMKDARADFDHPAVPIGSELRRHCLYRITRADWRSGCPSPPSSRRARSN